MRTKIIAVMVLAMMLAVTFGAPAFAQPHEGSLCEAPNHPGHTEYAQHHVVLLAQQQALGAGHEGGHVPGTHQGYAGLCGVQVPE